MAWTAPATYTTSEVVTAAKLNTHLRDNTKEIWRELAYVEFTADVNATAGTHTEAAPLDVVSAGALTFTAEKIIVEFYSPYSRFTANSTQFAGLSLWEGTDLGRLFAFTPPGTETTSSPIHVSRELTPTAASHTYKVRVWAQIVANTSAQIRAGAGGAGTFMPGFIRIWQKGG